MTHMVVPRLLTRLGEKAVWIALALMALTLACRPDEGSLSPQPSPHLDIRLGVTPLSGATGRRVAVRILAEASNAAPLRGLQGVLRFDPAKLRYVGQPLEGTTAVLVNADDSLSGTLPVVSLSLTLLEPATAELTFDILRADYLEGLSYRVVEAVTADLQVIADVRVATAPVEMPGTPSRMPPRYLSVQDWAGHLGVAGGPAGPKRLPGQGTIYGDATLDLAINVLDALHTANLAVGNRQLLTDPSKDYVIAANVSPFNLPGLGEAGDANPPGRNTDGTYTITVLDAVAVANEAVGNDQAVAGEVVPGRAIPADRVILTGNIDSGVVRTLSRDTVYELQGMVNVLGSGTLVIESGTRIEGDVATRGSLVVRRGGTIDAQGTRLQPIIFTCNAATKTRGCWGGLSLSGFSLLNNGEILPGGSDVNGCPQKIGPVHPGYYGGCLIQNNSGILRYVRIEYAGMANPGQGPVAGLALLGVGSSTVIDSVQVYGSLGDGIYVGGGTVNFRSVLITNNAGDGLRWEDGWVGKGQFIIIQQDADNDHAIHGINFGLNPNAGPRSAPQLYHLSISGPPTGLGATGAGILLEHGTDAIIRNAVVYRAGGAGLDISGPETCARASVVPPFLRVENSIFFAGNPDFAADADCLDEAVYAMDPARSNRVLDPGLIAPGLMVSADFRPQPGSPALSGFIVPPSDGFFDLTASYLGAVGPANSTGSNIPWYAGWTRGWNGVP